jgi:hypothetical protein
VRKNGLSGSTSSSFEQIELRCYSPPHRLDDIARDQPEVVYAIVFRTLEPAEDPFSRLSGDAQKLVKKGGGSLATDNEAPKLSKKERQVLVESIVGVLDEDLPSRISKHRKAMCCPVKLAERYLLSPTRLLCWK